MSSQLHAADAASTCLRVKTSTDSSYGDAGGYLNVFVNTGDGNGYKEVTGASTDYYAIGSTVVNGVCYPGLLGVQVRGPSLNGWAGSIEASIDGGNTYAPMVCKDKCTPAGGITSTIAVDGNDDITDSTLPVTCLNGEICTLALSQTANPSKAPSPGPTNLPTPGPSHSPTMSPTTASPTANPSKAPSPGPTNLPTPGPSHSPTMSPTPAIDSWDLELTSFDSNFTIGSQSEFTVSYKIGAGRKFEFSVLKKGCKEAVDTAVITPTNSTSPNEDDPSLENLSVFLDVEKDTIVGSNIWDSTNEIVELCIRVELLSSISGNVVKKLEHDFGIELLFNNTFETADEAQFGQIILGSNQTDAQVDDYIEACTCDSKESFECNQNVLGPDEFLNVCIKSVAEEMEINYLDSLKMVQEDETLSIVWDKDLVDGSISSKSKVALKNGVHVASVIPASFFSYDKPSTAQVSGVVFLKLSGSRRRLAVEIDDPTSTAARARALQSAAAAGDQESAFAIEVQLVKKNEFELGGTADSESNSAIYAAMTGFIDVAAAVVVAAAISMTMW